LGFLVNGALVLLRRGDPHALADTGLAITAVMLGIVVVSFGYVRSRRLTMTATVGGRITVACPRMAVLAIGYGTAALAVASVLVLDI
jgi:hypothetical protein